MGGSSPLAQCSVLQHKVPEGACIPTSVLHISQGIWWLWIQSLRHPGAHPCFPLSLALGHEKPLALLWRVKKRRGLQWRRPSLPHASILVETHSAAVSGLHRYKAARLIDAVGSHPTGNSSTRGRHEGSLWGANKVFLFLDIGAGYVNVCNLWKFCRLFITILAVFLRICYTSILNRAISNSYYKNGHRIL